MGGIWAARLALGPGICLLLQETSAWIATRIKPAVRLVVLAAGERVPPALEKAASAFMSKEALMADCDVRFRSLHVLLRFVPRYNWCDPDPAWDQGVPLPSRIRNELGRLRDVFSVDPI